MPVETIPSRPDEAASSEREAYGNPTDAEWEEIVRYIKEDPEPGVALELYRDPTTYEPEPGTDGMYARPEGEEDDIVDAEIVSEGDTYEPEPGTDGMYARPEGEEDPAATPDSSLEADSTPASAEETTDDLTDVESDTSEIDIDEIIREAEAGLGKLVSADSLKAIAHVEETVAVLEVKVLNGSRRARRQLKKARAQLQEVMTHVEQEALDKANSLNMENAQASVSTMLAIYEVNQSSRLEADEMDTRRQKVYNAISGWSRGKKLLIGATVGVPAALLISAATPILGAGAAAVGLGWRGYRGYVNRKARVVGGSGDKAEFENAVRGTRDERIKAVFNADSSGKSAYEVATAARVDNKDLLDKAEKRAKNNRNAVFYAGVGVAGGALAGWAIGEAIDHFAGGNPIKIDAPENYPQEVPAGVTTEDYAAFIEESKDWTPRDHYNFGRMVQHLENHTDQETMDAMKVADSLSPEPNAPQIDAALEGVLEQEHDITALSRLGALEQAFGNGELSTDQVQSRFDGMLNDFDSDYMNRIYQDRQTLLRDEELRRIFDQWWKTRR